KMTDFINNRYSYEFTATEPNEIGDVHAKFNSMAQKVLSQIEELKSLDKAKTEFLSIASHELRTPLTSIKGSLGLLNSGVAGKMNETSQSLMTIALEETERLIRIINELLDLAKIEARQFPLHLEWVYAKKLCDKTFASLDGFCQPTNIKLAAQGCDDLDLNIDVDRCQQVLTNLLSNAIKYSPEGETVTVQFILDEDNNIRVEVSDRGRGISPDDQEIIFEKFRQATNAQNPLVKGTGLGLAIAKAIVEQHGGQIGVRSTPGEGSTFYFTLPKWRQHVSQGEVAA
ncbi:MAG: HAMP domain-containing histidine kinase, partial [Bdellovibrionales bacterium]|nr:HAMP domain-containing histidine kinase [Bdellovibrionales bacterium]